MKRIVILFVVLIFIGLTNSASQSVNVSYTDYFGGVFYNEIYSQSILLKVATPNSTLCRYNTISEDFSYENGNDFGLAFNNVSEITLTGLTSGVHNYYIKCYSGDSSSITVSLLVNPPVTGSVVLSGEEPLKEGRVDVMLVTSKSVSQVPTLKYSFDGIVYNPLTLVGSGTNWKGYLVIKEDVGEGLVSFKMDATDLEGRTGTEIINGAVYAIDTVKPKTVSSINAEGYNGGIEIKWHLDEEFDHFNIYRSESPNVAYTDLYQDDIRDDDYRDTSVVKGKTYYYKVSAVDDAGNEGGLSIEVYATPTESNNSGTILGLALNLQGEVDSLLNEIDFAISEVEEIKSSVSYKADKEKELFSLMKFDSEINSAIEQLGSLRKDALKYKQQDLIRASLEQKIASSELKIAAIKKKIPEDIMILKEGSSNEDVFDEESLRKAIIEGNPFLDESQIEKSAKKSKVLSEERGLVIESNFYVMEVLYSDGSRKTFSAVRRELNSEFDKSDDGDFFEVIPKEVVETASKIVVGNQKYDVIKDDPVLSFGSDTKEIFYYFEGESEIDLLKETSINFVSIDIEENSSLITGYFSFGVEDKKSTGIVLGIILLLVILGYLFYRRRNSFSDNYFSLLKKIKEVDEAIGKNPIESIEREYSYIGASYNSLSNNEKGSVYHRIEKLRDKIFVLKIEEGLAELRKSWDKNLFLKMEKIYNSMTEKNRKKLREVFMQVKRDVELKEVEAKGEANVSGGKKEVSKEEGDKNKMSSEEKEENKNEEKKE